MTISTERCREILKAARGSRVLVVGDMVVDEHIIGHSTRLSREAPVPVIEQRGHLFVPGGAANPAYNARSLGSDVSVCGLVGDDEMGGQATADFGRSRNPHGGSGPPSRRGQPASSSAYGRAARRSGTINRWPAWTCRIGNRCRSNRSKS